MTDAPSATQAQQIFLSALFPTAPGVQATDQISPVYQGKLHFLFAAVTQPEIARLALQPTILFRKGDDTYIAAFALKAPVRPDDEMAREVAAAMGMLDLNGPRPMPLPFFGNALATVCLDPFCTTTLQALAVMVSDPDTGRFPGYR